MIEQDAIKDLLKLSKIDGKYAPKTNGCKIRAGAILDELQNEFSNIKIGTRIVNLQNATIEDFGKFADLTEKETELLKALVDAQEKPIASADILKQIWGYADGLETHTLQTHIYRLRQKLEDDPANPKFLITSNDGYKLIS